MCINSQNNLYSYTIVEKLEYIRHLRNLSRGSSSAQKIYVDWINTKKNVREILKKVAFKYMYMLLILLQIKEVFSKSVLHMSWHKYGTQRVYMMQMTMGELHLQQVLGRAFLEWRWVISVSGDGLSFIVIDWNAYKKKMAIFQIHQKWDFSVWDNLI